MEVSVLDIKGQETGRKVALNDAVFGIEPNDHVLYLDVKQYLANQRQGTAKSKERSEVSGSTRKLGRQKGGGGARRAADGRCDRHEHCGARCGADRQPCGAGGKRPWRGEGDDHRRERLPFGESQGMRRGRLREHEGEELRRGAR